MIDCCLCTNLASDDRQPWDRPIFESTNFVALPSLGSLVEGWLLLVPKQHVIATGALDGKLADELQQVKSIVAAQLRDQYGGEVCVFEHGPSTNKRPVGCSVDHAHLHAVPLNFNLAEAAVPFLPDSASWRPATADSCRAAFQAGQDYLYVEQPIGTAYIATHDMFGSQILRKAVATRLGIPGEYSWREYPQLDVVARTITTLAGIAPVNV
jgi:ATP adenylyltransferase